MLAIEVEFLLGRYAATDYRDRDRAEWPPHPDRLFSAMVAALYEARLGESARAALLWLESQPPPQLCAGESAAEQTPLTVFVPINDPVADLLPQRAERRPRSFPSVVPEVPRVWFVWPDASPDATLTSLLGAVLSHVTYLGTSRSPVRMRLDNDPPLPNWVPDADGHALLRVPFRGRLEGLDWHFGNNLRPPPGAFQRYRCGDRTEQATLAGSIYGEMVIYHLGGEAVMEAETTLRLTNLLRAAAVRRAQEVLGEVPELLSGHESGRPAVKPHAAYLALPFVSDRQVHADGHILGMAVALPREVATSERRRAVRALAALTHLSLGQGGRLMLNRLTPEVTAHHNLRPATWCGPARRWASATPVLLDRFPKRGGQGLEQILAKSCANVGLPTPIEVVASRQSPLFGTPPSFRFVTRRSSGAGNEKDLPRLFTHVILTFEQPVRGPVLLGAGRHFGLGLFRPLQEEGQP